MLDRAFASRIRFSPASRAGHAESFFLKANDPAGGRAIWVKFTILAPRGRPEDAVAEVWAVVFDRERGHVAGKETFPIASALLESDPLLFAVEGNVLGPAGTRGRVRATGASAGEATGAIAWDLRFAGDAPPLALLPAEALYEIDAFPRTKQIAPWPDARVEGRIEVAGRAIEVAAWPGALGHNWGRGHASRYAWAQVNALRVETDRDRPGTNASASGSVFEGTSAKLRLGPIETPWLTLLLLRHGGREYDFRGLRHWWSRDVEVESAGGALRWSFGAEGEEARLRGVIEAARADVVGLRYHEPDGGSAACLNSKLARCRLELSLRTRRGFEPPLALVSDAGAALEVLSRERDPGVRLLVG